MTNKLLTYILIAVALLQFLIACLLGQMMAAVLASFVTGFLILIAVMQTRWFGRMSSWLAQDLDGGQKDGWATPVLFFIGLVAMGCAFVV